MSKSVVIAMPSQSFFSSSPLPSCAAGCVKKGAYGLMTAGGGKKHIKIAIKRHIILCKRLINKLPAK